MMLPDVASMADVSWVRPGAPAAEGTFGTCPGARTPLGAAAVHLGPQPRTEARLGSPVEAVKEKQIGEVYNKNILVIYYKTFLFYFNILYVFKINDADKELRISESKLEMLK